MIFTENNFAVLNAIFVKMRVGLVNCMRYIFVTLCTWIFNISHRSNLNANSLKLLLLPQVIIKVKSVVSIR